VEVEELVDKPELVSFALRNCDDLVLAQEQYREDLGWIEWQSGIIRT
jgi:hypothetical protein